MNRSCKAKGIFNTVFGLSIILAMVFGSLGVLGISTATAATKATLRQYANDPPVSWDAGNLGASKSTYYEGDTIPYRLDLAGITEGTHSVTVEWDTTKAGYHAIDYITTYNITESPDPCLGLSATICAQPISTYPIPDDPQVIAASVTTIPGVFTLYGGTITGTSAYTYSPAGYTGDTSARITIEFTIPSGVTDAVLLWGGHIATRADWGMSSSAVMITGSPYHTRFLDLDGSGGNQDRSLSADAVIYQGKITIIKQTIPENSGAFSFTASPAPLANFTLDSTFGYTQVFDSIEVFQTYTISEVLPTGWTLNSLTCVIDPLTANGGSISTVPATGTAAITLAEGENVTCTYVNEAHVDISVTKADGDYSLPRYPTVGTPFKYSITITNSATSATAFNVQMIDTLDPYLKFIDNDPSYPVKIDGVISLDACSWVDNGIDPVGAGGTLTCSIGDMLTGQSILVEYYAYAFNGAPLAGHIEIADSCTVVDSSDICNTVYVGTDSTETILINNYASEPKDIELPTAVTLSWFEVTKEGRFGIWLGWETSSENDLIGYKVYRSARPERKNRLLSPDVINALAPGELIGAVYSFKDLTAKPNKTYYYWLEAINMDGSVELFGPVSGGLNR